MMSASLPVSRLPILRLQGARLALRHARPRAAYRHSSSVPSRATGFVQSLLAEHHVMRHLEQVGTLHISRAISSHGHCARGAAPTQMMRRPDDEVVHGTVAGADIIQRHKDQFPYGFVGADQRSAAGHSARRIALQVLGGPRAKLIDCVFHLVRYLRINGCECAYRVASPAHPYRDAAFRNSQ